MSKLIDKLNQISQASPQLMGFKTASAPQSQPKMLLIASLAQGNFDDAAGADAGLLPISESSSGAKAIKEALQAVSSIPWGGRLKDTGQEEIAQMAEAGCDFVVFPAATTVLPALQGNAVGKILEVEVSLSEGLLRAVDKLPVDAVLIGGEQQEGYFLTWHRLLHFQHCANLLTKPLLAFIPSNVTAIELQAIWETGVDGVVVGVGAGQPADRLTELHQAIDSLTLPSKRKRGKPAALLPHVARRTDRVTEEPEEE
jgi:hypothetical protein